MKATSFTNALFWAGIGLVAGIFLIDAFSRSVPAPSDNEILEFPQQQLNELSDGQLKYMLDRCVKIDTSESYLQAVKIRDILLQKVK